MFQLLGSRVSAALAGLLAASALATITTSLSANDGSSPSNESSRLEDRALAEQRLHALTETTCWGSSDATVVVEPNAIDVLAALEDEPPGWVQAGVWWGESSLAAEALDSEVVVDGVAAVWVLSKTDNGLVLRELLRHSTAEGPELLILASTIVALDEEACAKYR